MANGYFERGEIYWVSLGNGLSEISVTRPAVIVSSEKVNRKGQVAVVFMTTKEKANDWDVFTDVTGKDSWIKCDNITTVSTSYLGKCIGVLNSAEMRSVEDSLEKVFDLGYVDDMAVKEKEAEIAARDIQIKELKEEVAKLQAEIAARADDDMARKVETEMWQRLYEKALDQVCSMKLTGDVTRRVEKSPVVNLPPVKRDEPVEDEPKQVDINTAKFNELRACGFSNNIALAVINNRPFESVEDLKNLPGVNVAMYGIISKKVCCVAQPKPKKITVEPDAGCVAEAPSTEKVNINTATGKEIMATLGVGNNAAYAVTSHRKKNGLFTRVEELSGVRYWSEGMLAKHRDKLEV